ncbi:YdcF family protein [Cellulophaga baltica]|uniref:SanA/YdcF family protein n=1 Tax=Cellulophaga TaxID=104264 RepID=UPI001C07CB39|nr:MULTISPECIES: ElyC/SanA/YdcF family protein [Cellulophaga]MBU2995178.1 YdcF family protein [Cellulophaga baltica]MDO6766573.1 ElyC/SanA/YdcF family protein [Cellulophaga sp. 1_MG-2023]
MVKKILFTLVSLLLLFCITLFVCYAIIENSSNGKTFSEVENIPKNRVGLILGTAKKLTTGKANPYYTNRINATVELFNAKKIDFVLVSGDNGSIYYNEPTAIKKDLIEAGIPKEKIFLDYAGFRTLDSMVRAKHIFNLDSVTVISQKFHNDRAIYIAQKKGLTAIGFNATDLSGANGFKVQLREYFARVKVFIDIATNKQPKFYGDKIEIK